MPFLGKNNTVEICSFFIKASLIKTSKRTKWSMVLFCFRKSHWKFAIILLISRNLVNLLFIILSNVLPKQLVNDAYDLLDTGCFSYISSFREWHVTAKFDGVDFFFFIPIYELSGVWWIISMTIFMFWAFITHLLLVVWASLFASFAYWWPSAPVLLMTKNLTTETP